MRRTSLGKKIFEDYKIKKCSLGDCTTERKQYLQTNMNRKFLSLSLLPGNNLHLIRKKGRNNVSIVSDSQATTNGIAGNQAF